MRRLPTQQPISRLSPHCSPIYTQPHIFCLDAKVIGTDEQIRHERYTGDDKKLVNGKLAST